MKKCYLAFMLLCMAYFGYSQPLNTLGRFPLTPDMPEWARSLYANDEALNVFELDRLNKPWQLKYDSLRIEMANAGDTPGEALRNEFEYYKKYQKYYIRWRARVYPYMQQDGSIDFSIKLEKETPIPYLKSNTANWSFLGPVVTRWRQNDNAAQPLAPFQANVYCLDVAPSNGNIVYCGTETGVVNKSIDKGLTWTTVGANVFTNNIGAIAIHPTNPDIVYVSEFSRYIRSTTDGGASWQTVLDISSFNCEDIKIKPDEPEVVLASGNSGLRRRTAGNVWTSVISSKTYDIAFQPGNPLVAYALVRNAGADLCEFWKSTDGGQTWSVRSTGWISGAGFTDGGGRITVTPAAADRIYCALLTGNGPRIMRSDDAGETWTIIAASSETGLIGPCTNGPLSMTNGQGFFDLSIVASHDNPDHLIVGTTTSFKSTDGGTTWATLGGYCGSFSIHPDMQEAVARGADTWIVTDGGVNLSTDFFTNSSVGVNYFVRTNNLRGSEHWGFDIGWNEDVVVGGRYHNGNTAWREGYPAGDYLRMGGGEAPTGYVNPGNNSLTYFSDLGGRILPANNTQAVGSFTVSKWPNESFYPMEGAEQKWDPRYMYTYYLGQGHQLWKTTDNGLSFTPIFTHLNSDARVRYVEVSRSNPDFIYITVYLPSPSTDGQLWKTDNGGTTWVQCANPGTLTASQRRFSKITMSGTDHNTIWWAFRTGPNGQKIFKSTDGGATWTNWTTSTLNNIDATDILHQLGTDGGVYFVSGNGAKVYYRDNSANDWMAYDTGLPLNMYGDFGGAFLKAFYKGGKLRLAGGHGIWEADLCAVSTTTLVQPMVDNPAPTCSRDTIQLESYSVINGNASYQWSLSPAPQWISDANARNPRVVLGSTPGAYSVTLSVTDDNGTATRTINDMIQNLATGNLCGADHVPGKALSLDGSGDFAQANTPLNLNSNTVTMTAWVKRNGAQVDFSGLVYARGGTTSAGLSITSSNQLRYTWDDAAGSYGFNTGFTIPDNAWTHVALAITPTSAKVYMNGVAATRNATHNAEAFDTPLKIGYDQGSRYFKGEIDEVTVWNVSLTQEQIRELMHLTIEPADWPGLVSYYQFNEPSGNANDKIGTRHAALAADATRVVSTGPFGGGASHRKTITGGGVNAFTGTDVTLSFPATGTYPNGEIVVSRINNAPDSIPACSAYLSDNHYWIIDNYGSNQTFSALESAIFGNISVPSTASIPAISYKLNHRTVNAHLLPWALMPGSSTEAQGGANGSITFGTGSGITQFGQFVASNTLVGQFITGPASVCSGSNATLDAGAGYSSYNWSNGGGSGQMATFNNLSTATTIFATVTDNDGCSSESSFTIDVTPVQIWYKDADDDGYAETGAPTITQCDRPIGYKVASELTATTGDCNDNNAAINPAATEVCDGVDNNCNGSVDEGVQTTYYLDADGDGYYTGTPVMACTSPGAGYVTSVTGGGDCNDNNALEFPGQIWYKDSDNDGYSDGTTLTQCLRPAGYKVASELTATTGDCNDNNAAINPGATEVCDGVDNNCNGSVDEGVQTTYYLDADGDGYYTGTPVMACTSPGAGYVTSVTGGGDCNDNNALEFPGQIWYKDSDNDGYSDGTTLTQCLRPAGYKVASELTATTGDCNDNNAAINPGATEVCDGVDNNCNGSVDEGVQTTYYLDADGDGYYTGTPVMACTSPGAGYVTSVTGGGDCNDNNALEFPGQIWYKDSDNDGYSDGTTLTQCLRPAGYKVASELTATTGDCNDNNAAINPGATEVCDGVDNNCNGSVDEGVQTTYYLDADGDGYYTGTPVMACTSPGAGYVTSVTGGGDCNDNNALEFPGQIWYKDSDNDGYSDGTTLTQCLRPAGYKVASELTATTGDCNDNNAAINPGATEVCDGVDNNCNGTVDEGVQTTYYLDADGDGYYTGTPVMACTSPGAGYVTSVTGGGDCNDNNALEFPGQIWYKDSDNDGYSDGTTLTQCLRPAGYKVASELTATTGDCNDNNAAINPGATEVCGNGIDDNCNGDIDEGCCPDLSTAPSEVLINNGTCGAACQPVGAGISAPTSGCPAGSTIQYSVNNGGWSNMLPLYANLSTGNIIRTRCSCDSDPLMTGPASAGTPVGSCTDNTPPTITCASHATLNFNGQNSIQLDGMNGPVDFQIVANDNCGVQSITITPSVINANQVGQIVPVLITVSDQKGNTATCSTNLTVSGLPAGWSAPVNGIGCTNGSDVDYNTATGVWTVASTNCYYGPNYTTDSEAFAQRTLCGDGSITALVTGINPLADGWAGLVMRENASAGAKKAQLMTNLNNLSRREFRTATNGAAVPQQFPSQNRFWLRIVRTGHQFVLYVSPNGTTWYPAGSQSIVMQSCIEVGLVLTNYTSNSTVTGTFSNVGFTQVNPISSGQVQEQLTLGQIEFDVFPNPTSGELNLDLTQYIGRSVRIETYSLEGKLLQFTELDEVQTTLERIDIKGLQNGMYLVKVKSAGLPDVTRRIVKQ